MKHVQARFCARRDQEIVSNCCGAPVKLVEAHLCAGMT